MDKIDKKIICLIFNGFNRLNVKAITNSGG